MDQKLLFLINREWTSAGADRFMAILSSWDAWLPLVAILALVLLIGGDFRARAFVLVSTLVIAGTDGLVSKTLKRIVDRPRPHQVLNDVRVVDLRPARPRFLAALQPVRVKMSRPDLGDVEGRSFPSSHTMNMFAAALVAVGFFGRRAAGLFVFAALVAYSRIYTGAHWPSDVITSMFLGLGVAMLLLGSLELLWRRRGEAWLPRLHMRHPSLLAA